MKRSIVDTSDENQEMGSSYVFGTLIWATQGFLDQCLPESRCGVSCVHLAPCTRFVSTELSMMSLFSWLRPPPPVNPPGISISSRRKSGLEAVTLPAQSQTPRCALTQARLCLHYQSQLSSGSSLPHGPTATDPGSHTCILRSSYRIHRLLVTYRTTRRLPHISRVKTHALHPGKMHHGWRGSSLTLFSRAIVLGAYGPCLC